MKKIRSIRDPNKLEYLLTHGDDNEKLDENTLWSTLHQFGISKEQVMKKNMSNEELYSIHVAVRTYNNCIKALHGMDEYT